MWPNLHCALFSVGRRLKEDRDELAGRSHPMRSNSLSVSAHFASSARTTSAITPTPCPQHTAFRSTGYLYQLDAMQQVSFPDINKDDPKTQTIAAAVQEHTDPRPCDLSQIEWTRLNVVKTP